MTCSWVTKSCLRAGEQRESWELGHAIEVVCKPETGCEGSQGFKGGFTAPRPNVYTGPECLCQHSVAALGGLLHTHLSYTLSLVIIFGLMASFELTDLFSSPGLQNCESFTASHPALKSTSFSFSSLNFMLVISFSCVWKVKWTETEHAVEIYGEPHFHGRMTQNQRQTWV